MSLEYKISEHPEGGHKIGSRAVKIHARIGSRRKDEKAWPWARADITDEDLAAPALQTLRWRQNHYAARTSEEYQ